MFQYLQCFEVSRCQVSALHHLWDALTFCETVGSLAEPGVPEVVAGRCLCGYASARAGLPDTQLKRKLAAGSTMWARARPKLQVSWLDSYVSTDRGPDRGRKHRAQFQIATDTLADTAGSAQEHTCEVQLACLPVAFCLTGEEAQSRLLYVPSTQATV